MIKKINDIQNADSGSRYVGWRGFRQEDINQSLIHQCYHLKTLTGDSVWRAFIRCTVSLQSVKVGLTHPEKICKCSFSHFSLYLQLSGKIKRSWCSGMSTVDSSQVFWKKWEWGNRRARCANGVNTRGEQYLSPGNTKLLKRSQHRSFPNRTIRETKQGALQPQWNVTMTKTCAHHIKKRKCPRRVTWESVYWWHRK